MFFGIQKISWVCIALIGLSHCAPRKTGLRSNIKSSEEEIPLLTTEQIGQLSKMANNEWGNPETKMAWLALTANFLRLVEKSNKALEKLNVPSGNKSVQGLSLANDRSFDSSNTLSLDEQKFQLSAAESAGRQALDQQRIMLDQDRMSRDYEARSAEFFKGYDQQRFDQNMKTVDQQIKVANAEADIQGKRVQNLQQMIEAKKKVIENDILGSYASAFNSYVKSFHEYTQNMTTVFKGANKVSRSATRLASSILTYDKKVKQCSSAILQQQTKNFRETRRLLKLSDYVTASVRNERGMTDRVQLVKDMPYGAECLEYGLIQSNIDEFEESMDDPTYILQVPIFFMQVNTEADSDPASRTLVACPAVSQKEDPMSLKLHVGQVEKYANKVGLVADNLKRFLVSPDDANGPASDGASTENATESTEEGSVYDSYTKANSFDLATAFPIEARRADDRELLIPFPATPNQLVQQVVKGLVDLKSQTSSSAYCERKPTDKSSTQRFLNYVKSIRSFESVRIKMLRIDLEQNGVKFRSNGQIELNGDPYNSRGAPKTSGDRVESQVRRGLYYAQQCTQMVGDFLEQSGKLSGAKSVALPAATEVTIGANKYSFFYPPYSLGDDASTLENELTKVTRLCVDSALMELSKSQQALGAAAEYQKYFSDAANIKAPASPIPYIPNPQTGTTIYSR